MLKFVVIKLFTKENGIFFVYSKSRDALLRLHSKQGLHLRKHASLTKFIFFNLAEMMTEEGLKIQDITENFNIKKEEFLKERENEVREDSNEKKMKNEQEKENIEKNSIAKIPEEKEKFGLPR